LWRVFYWADLFLLAVPRPSSKRLKLEIVMDRRQFLVRSAALAGVIITPKFVERAWEHQEVSNAPLLLKPQVKLRYLLSAFPLDDHYSLDLLNVNGDELDTMPATFGLMLTKFGYQTHQEQIEFLMEGWALDASEAREMLMAPAPDDWAEIYWDRHGGPQALAHHLLKGLDLGAHFSKRKSPSRVGAVTFVDGYHPGCDMLGVQVPDDFSLSLLQARFNELHVPVQVVVVGAS
jgi:hypothetical protein